MGKSGKEYNLQSIVLGGGCFWCIEACYQLFRGVESVISGYSGGSTPNPNYHQVSAGQTGHAEVVLVEFQPNIVSLEQILKIFWTIHDPTTPNRQGHDTGSQYRSIVLFNNGEQETTAHNVKMQMQKYWDNKIITEIKPLKHFYRAEDHHQNYYINNPEASYCQIIINPKLIKVKNTFEGLLKLI